MRQSGRKRESLFAFDAQTIRAFFTARHPQKTAQCVAACSDVSLRTVEKWLDGSAAPSFSATCSLVAAYGPEFLATCLPGLGWLSAAAAEAQRQRLELELQTIERRLAALGTRGGAHQ